MQVTVTGQDVNELYDLAKKFIFQNYPLGSRVRTAKIEKDLNTSAQKLRDILETTSKKSKNNLFSVGTCVSGAANCPDFSTTENLTKSEEKLLESFLLLNNNDNLVTEIAAKTREYKYLNTQKQTPLYKLGDTINFLQTYIEARKNKGTVRVVKPPSQYTEDEVRLRVDITNIFSAIRLLYTYNNLLNVKVNVSAEKLFDELSDAIDNLLLDK